MDWERNLSSIGAREIPFHYEDVGTYAGILLLLRQEYDRLLGQVQDARREKTPKTDVKDQMFVSEGDFLRGTPLTLDLNQVQVAQETVEDQRDGKHHHVIGR